MAMAERQQQRYSLFRPNTRQFSWKLPAKLHHRFPFHENRTLSGESDRSKVTSEPFGMLFANPCSELFRLPLGMIFADRFEEVTIQR